MKLEAEMIGDEAFYRALNKMVVTGKRTSIAVIDENFKGVIRNLLAISPPLGGKQADFKLNAKGGKTGGVNFAAGKRRGQSTISADIAKAFRKAKSKKLQSFGNEQEALSWYLGARNARKRIKGNPKRPASPGQIAFVRKNILARQGSFLAGWSKAASYFKITLPKWVTRHGAARSRMFPDKSEWGYYLTAINVTTHREGDKIERIAKIAMETQTKNMVRQIDGYAKEQAKASGFTV